MEIKKTVFGLRAVFFCQNIKMTKRPLNTRILWTYTREAL